MHLLLKMLHLLLQDINVLLRIILKDRHLHTAHRMISTGGVLRNSSSTKRGQWGVPLGGLVRAPCTSEEAEIPLRGVCYRGETVCRLCCHTGCFIPFKWAEGGTPVRGVWVCGLAVPVSLGFLLRGWEWGVGS